MLFVNFGRKCDYSKIYKYHKLVDLRPTYEQIDAHYDDNRQKWSELWFSSLLDKW